MNTRKEMIYSIHSMNKVLSYEWLNEQTDEILLSLCHPLDRDECSYGLKQENSENEKEE